MDLHYPIWIASKNGFTDIVKLLIEAGADVNQENEASRSSPLRAAAQKGWTDVCQLLVNAGAEITDSRGDIAQAAEDAEYDDIVKLIRAGQS